MLAAVNYEYAKELFIPTSDDAESTIPSSDCSSSCSSRNLHEAARSKAACKLTGLLHQCCRRAVLVLCPSFLHRIDTLKTDRLHPTSHLDGLRGLAAFAVFLCHLSYSVFNVTHAYGAGDLDEYRQFLRLPILRLFYSGPPMVAIFVVVSGFALSYKPLKQMRAGAYDGLLESMSSATFRRAIRLFLPCIISTLGVLACVELGLYEYTRPFEISTSLLRATHEWHPHRLATWSEQLADYSEQMFNFVHVWSWDIFDGSTHYDVHLWTIPLEFRASLALFLTQLACARLRPRVRVALVLCLIGWAMRWGRWEVILFWAGMLLAEWSLVQSARPPLGPSASEAAPSKARLARCGWAAVFLCACYLASYPDRLGATTPGFRRLATWVPGCFSEPYRFWQCVGAVLLVAAVNNAAFLQAPLNGPAVQYLGRISYALYLVHGPVVHLFGYAVMPLVWGLTGADTALRFRLGFACAACLIVPAVVWAADVFWRVVDAPTVRFARWLEQKCIVR